MPKVDIVITRDLSYATRRLKAGDRLSVSERDAKVLVGIGKAERAREPAKIPAPPPSLAEALSVSKEDVTPPTKHPPRKRRTAAKRK